MSELASYYAGTEWEYLFTQTFSEITYRVPVRAAKLWAPNTNPGDGEYKIYNAVGYILDELHQLSQDSAVRHSLLLYMDMFLPLVHYMELHGYSDELLCSDLGGGAPIEQHMPTSCFHEGMLPNYVAKLMQCSFWSDNGKQEPIVHLLSKSTPQRCQIRSLTHIVYNYSRLNDDVYDFLLSAFKCSLLGGYRGVQRPSFTQRLAIHKQLETMEKHVFL